MSKRASPAFGNLADVAKAAGVSVSTVSRALAGNQVINTQTRERIVALARAHGFQPNQMARNLRLRRAQAIGLVLPLGHETGQHLSDPFFNTMLGHLADAVTARSYDLLLSRVIPVDDGWLDRLVDSGRIDGVLIVGQSDQTAVLDRVAARYGPLVVWGAHSPDHVHITVGTDNRLGGAMAAQHLIDTGRTRLAFYGNPEAPEIAQRREGFVAACAKAGIAGSMTFLPVHLTIDETYNTIADHLSRNPAPDGIVAASDIIAMGAIRALTERRLRVPEDVAVIGYDDVMLAAHTTPALTTIRQQITRGAALLVELLFQRLAGKEASSVVLAPELVVRGSTVF